MSRRIYTVNKKAVKILERHTHTYVVEYVVSGQRCSVKKEYIKSFVPKEKPPKPTNINPKQQRLEF